MTVHRHPELVSGSQSTKFGMTVIFYATITLIMESYVYILTNEYNSVLYIGVTSNLIKRSWEHKNKIIKGFSQTYGVTKLIYYEIFSDIKSAIIREKQLKNWHRKWKFNLIKQKNPEFKDLYNEIL